MAAVLGERDATLTASIEPGALEARHIRAFTAGLVARLPSARRARIRDRRSAASGTIAWPTMRIIGRRGNGLQRAGDWSRTKERRYGAAWRICGRWVDVSFIDIDRAWGPTPTRDRACGSRTALGPAAAGAFVTRPCAGNKTA